MPIILYQSYKYFDNILEDLLKDAVPSKMNYLGFNFVYETHMLERNKYQHKTARTWIKKVRLSEDKTEADTVLRETFSKLDKLVKKNIIHKNKAANLKSKLAKHVASLA